MKAKLFAVILLLVGFIAPAKASDAWIKVDANGNAIGGAIVCDRAVCGDPNSLYSRLTLQPGERYVLQFKADPNTGNVAGIPATDPNVTLKVNTETNEWTKTTTQVLPEPTPININGNTVTVSEVKVVERWNPTVTPEPQPEPEPEPTPTPTPTPTMSETSTVTTGSSAETITVVTQNPETNAVATASTSETPVEEIEIDWLQFLYINWEALMAWFEAYFAEMSNQ